LLACPLPVMSSRRDSGRRCSPRPSPLSNWRSTTGRRGRSPPRRRSQPGLARERLVKKNKSSNPRHRQAGTSRASSSASFGGHLHVQSHRDSRSKRRTEGVHAPDPRKQRSMGRIQRVDASRVSRPRDSRWPPEPCRDFQRGRKIRCSSLHERFRWK